MDACCYRIIINLARSIYFHQTAHRAVNRKLNRSRVLENSPGIEAVLLATCRNANIPAMFLFFFCFYYYFKYRINI